MRTEFLALCIVYLLAGVCTIWTLYRNKMPVATAFYTVAFIVLLFFLPVFTGNDLFRQAVEEERVVFGTSEAAKNAISAAIGVAISYLKLPFFIAICLSLFLCLSAISVAVTAIRAVRAFRRARSIYRWVGAFTVRKIGTRHRVPKIHNYCHTFCRYNC